MDESIKKKLKGLVQRDALTRLIFLNCAIFLLLEVLRIVAKLFNISLFDFNPYIAVCSNFEFFVWHCWTVFTYMFVHYELFHILFNMLMLYWFGKIFLMYFTTKNLVALYIYGGLAGAIIYIVSFNLVPYFVLQGTNFMVGASAAVISIVFASAFYNKNLEVRLLLFGQVKIIYIAIALFIIDFLSLGGNSNLGGHVAHIGGALMGYLYAVQYKKGYDLTRGINRLIDTLVNLFKKQPKMKIKYKRPLSDFEYNAKKHQESEDIDMILDKIKQSGYKSLNESEKKRLFDASNK